MSPLCKSQGYPHSMQLWAVTSCLPVLSQYPISGMINSIRNILRLIDLICRDLIFGISWSWLGLNIGTVIITHGDANNISVSNDHSVTWRCCGQSRTGRAKELELKQCRENYRVIRHNKPVILSMDVDSVAEYRNWCYSPQDKWSSPLPILFFGIR